MIIVSDTSPLHYLVLAGQVEVLRQLYSRVLCPREIVAELSHPHAPAPVRLWAQALPAWIEVCDAPAWKHPELERLDAGEAAAIRLARELHADVLLIDERRGRQVAGRLGLRVAGVLAVLADAAKAGLLDFDHALSALATQTNFRASPRVIGMIRSRLSQA